MSTSITQVFHPQHFFAGLESDIQSEYVKQKLLQQQQRIMTQRIREQDEALNDLSMSLARLQDMSVQIGAELREQGCMLDNFDHRVNSINSKQSKKSGVVGFLRKSSTPSTTLKPSTTSSGQSATSNSLSSASPPLLTKLASVSSNKAQTVLVNSEVISEVNNNNNNTRIEESNNQSGTHNEEAKVETKSQFDASNEAMETKQEEEDREGDDKVAQEGSVVDVMNLPILLDQRLGEESAIRPVIFQISEQWDKHHYASLVSASATVKRVGKQEQQKELSTVLALLDALTRAGALTIDHSQLHILQGGMNCFDQSLLDTVIKKNINPIERMERAYVVMASILHSVQDDTIAVNPQIRRG